MKACKHSVYYYLARSIKATVCLFTQYNTLPLPPCSAVSQSRTPAVVYETVSDVVTTTGPDTSENVAYGVSQSLPATHNPAYGHKAIPKQVKLAVYACYFQFGMCCVKKTQNML